MSCKVLSREMLYRPIDVAVEGPALDFYCAKKVAEARARQLSDEPMLLAWYDRRAEAFSPRVE